MVTAVTGIAVQSVGPVELFDCPEFGEAVVQVGDAANLTRAHDGHGQDAERLDCHRYPVAGGAVLGLHQLTGEEVIQDGRVPVLVGQPFEVTQALNRFSVRRVV